MKEVFHVSVKCMPIPPDNEERRNYSNSNDDDDIVLYENNNNIWYEDAVVLLKNTSHSKPGVQLPNLQGDNLNPQGYTKAFIATSVLHTYADSVLYIHYLFLFANVIHKLDHDLNLLTKQN